MPLTELMNYFNDQLQTQARVKSLPKTGFYKADNIYWARFGSLILGSTYHPLNAFSDDKVLGYEAELIVRSSTGNRLNIDSIFNSLDSTDQITHLDRLVRTLHSLNYLQQFDGHDQLLSLQVQPRHIVSVTDDHGKAFEIILSDCGLKPERILLHTRLLDLATLKHFKKALESYKNRNYKIGINITQPRELTLLSSLDITPDVIFAHYPSLPLPENLLQGSANEAFLIPVEFYANKRILVSDNKDAVKHLESSFDGFLALPNTDFEEGTHTDYLSSAVVNNYLG